MNNSHLHKLREVYASLEAEGRRSTARHSRAVAKTALSLCEDNLLKEKVELACALHDISVIIPKEKWIETCEVNNIEIIGEERKLPLLVHQKLSAFIAKSKFGITDGDILSAVSCHTTLKEKASYLDLVLFVSDKISWDGIGEPPWLRTVNEGAGLSLFHAAYNYIDYITQNNMLLIPHPDLLKAYKWLKGRVQARI